MLNTLRVLFYDFPVYGDLTWNVFIGIIIFIYFVSNGNTKCSQNI